MSSEFKLSSYQRNIVDYIGNDTGNLLVDAKAGSGKTSTLLLIANEVTSQNKQCLFLAFNKSIVNELDSKVSSSNCMVKTLHSLGLMFIRSYLYNMYGTNFVLETDSYKLHKFIKPLIVEWCLEDIRQCFDTIDNKSINDIVADLTDEFVKLVQFIRFYNIDISDQSRLNDIMITKCDMLKEPDKNGCKNYMYVLEQTVNFINESFTKPFVDENTGKHIITIDFTDMLYFPVKMNMPIPFKVKPFLDYVLVDESQDLSILQQLFVKLLNNGKTRYIFVGDKKQAIYGFAGADTHSIDNIKSNFTLNELPLNICYRCPKNVVNISKTLVPDIEYNTDREDLGVVNILNKYHLVSKLQRNDLIIGRKNSDLLRLYIDLVLKKHYQVKFKNEALVKGILKTIDKCIREYIKRYNKHLNVEVKLDKIRQSAKIPKEIKYRDKSQQKYLLDKYKELVESQILQDENIHKQICKSNYTVHYVSKCIKEYIDLGEFSVVIDDDLHSYANIVLSFIDEYVSQHKPIGLDSFMKYLENFMTCNNNLSVPILSTVHMVKGSEADNVFILDYPLFPYNFEDQTPESFKQEQNLQYVAITRAKKSLNLVLIEPSVKCPDYDQKNQDCINLITNIVDPQMLHIY